MVAGPIAVAYNVKGVDKLVLTPEVIAKIFNGKITTWNDPAIAKVNPGVTLPSTPIKVFFRSDESGTTENFKVPRRRGAAAPGPPSRGRAGPARARARRSPPAWPGAVKTTEGGITYAEWSYAKDNKLGIAQVDNGGGAVELTGESAGKAVAAAKPDGEGNDLRLKLDYADQGGRRVPDRPRHLRDRLLKGMDAGQGRRWSRPS